MFLLGTDSIGGAIYIRWGRTSCPDTQGTEILYSGLAAGGASNYICLPNEHESLQVLLGGQGDRSKVVGVEYRSSSTSFPVFNDIRFNSVPCAVCLAGRETKIMIPGRVTCMPTWTREYFGYLMTNENNRQSYECVDVNAEGIEGTEAATSAGAFFHFTEASCIGLNCPPYTNGEELACVVCTK